MTPSSPVRLVLVGLLATALVLATATAGGLAGVGSHRTSTADVVGDPNGYIGVVPDPDDDLCAAVFTLTNFLDVTLTNVTVVSVEGATVSSVSTPDSLAPGESGDVVVELDAVGETTVDVVIVASDEGEATVRLYRSTSVDCAVETGTHTVGYWKTHPDDWPVESLTVGATTYTDAELVALLDTPPAGDKSRTLFAQYVAARLSVLDGAEASCVTTTLADADAWLTAHPVGSGVSGGSAAWKSVAQGGEGGDDLSTTLDSYVNGGLCAPHAD